LPKTKDRIFPFPPFPEEEEEEEEEEEGEEEEWTFHRYPEL
jgi:hypothetical protein